MIGSNTTLELQIKSKVTKNAMGEQEVQYETLCELDGYLDFTSGEANYEFNTKKSQSTHVFLMDYKELGENASEENTRIYEPKTNKIYDVLLIDDPLGRKHHLEIYLKLVGVKID